MTRDEKYINLALAQARIAAEIGEVPVGAVVVTGAGVIACGYNRREADRNPIAHAETEALRRAAEAVGGWRLDGCELFVTLEPCAMCAGAIISSRIKRVVFGAYDPREGFFGSVLDLSLYIGADDSIEVLGGVLQEECGQVIREFFERKRKDL